MTGSKRDKRGVGRREELADDTRDGGAVAVELRRDRAPLMEPLGESRILGEKSCPLGVAFGDLREEGRLSLTGTPCDQPTLDGRSGDRGEAHLDTATHKRVHARCHMVREQDEHRLGAGLFDRLQECGNRLRSEMDIFDDEHLTRGLKRPAAGDGDHAAGVVDVKGRTGVLNGDEVWVGSGEYPATGLAGSAAALRTQQRRGETSSSSSSTRPRSSDKEVGVDRVASGTTQELDRAFLAYHLVEEGERRSLRGRRALGHSGVPSRSTTSA